MAFKGFEEKDLPWLKDLDKDTRDACQGQIFPATLIVCCRSGYLVETNLFKCWLFDRSTAFRAVEEWETTIPVTELLPTPSVQLKKSAKNGFVFGFDEDNLCKVVLSGQIYFIHPHPSTPVGKGKVGK